jgi:hypothetical protein
MNGRIYDPTLGRFLQADPHIQAPNNSQNYNRYSYVLNNPMSYNDPSGFFFKSLGKFLKKNWRTIASIGLGYLTFGLGTGFAAIPDIGASALIGWGAAAGAVSGFISTGSLKGALQGAFSGALFGAVGAAGLTGAGTFGVSGLAGGFLSEVQGGNFGHGLISAGIGAVSGGWFGKGAMSNVLGSAIVGGTISKLTGGKFANGAFTAAFSSALRQDWSKKPDFSGMTNEQKTQWIRENYKSLGVEVAEGTSIEYVDEYVGLTRAGLTICGDSDCGGASSIAGTFEDGYITLYKSAFESSFTYVTESNIDGVQNIRFNNITNAGPMGKAIFTFGHEAAHSMGVDLINGDVYHTNGEAAGRRAYNRFKELYD